jgi:hypothetical protein
MHLPLTLFVISAGALVGTMLYDRTKWKVAPVLRGGITSGQIVWRVALFIATLVTGWLAFR